MAAKAAGDFIMNTEVLLCIGITHELARVLLQNHDQEQNPVGLTHRNPALDTCVYVVHFPDGRTEELAVNVISEAIYAQWDANGNQYVLLDTIVDYHKDPSMAVAWNNQVVVIDGKKTVKRSTRWQELCCKWKDGSASWHKLSNLKESHPLQVAEFMFAAYIPDEPAFNWWVSLVSRRGIG